MITPFLVLEDLQRYNDLVNSFARQVDQCSQVKDIMEILRTANLKITENIAENLESIISVVNMRLDPKKNKYWQIFGSWIEEGPFHFWKVYSSPPRGSFFIGNHLHLCQQKFKIQISQKKNVL